MRIPRVAVGAAELAADIGIDRPEPHLCRCGSIENRIHRQADEPGAAVALVEDGKAGRRGSGESRAVSSKVAEALGALRDALAYPLPAVPLSRRPPAPPPPALGAADAAGRTHDQSGTVGADPNRWGALGRYIVGPGLTTLRSNPGRLREWLAVAGPTCSRRSARPVR